MWIFTNNAFVSIVEHRQFASTLIVRGRFKGDAARFLGVPIALESETPNADYRFRVVAGRDAVVAAVTRATLAIDYPNFKDSIGAKFRKAIALRVWAILHTEQGNRHPREHRPPGPKFFERKTDLIGDGGVLDGTNRTTSGAIGQP